MKYIDNFDIFTFDFVGGACCKTVTLSQYELFKLGNYIMTHFEDKMPTYKEINDFVRLDCDKFFATIGKFYDPEDSEE